MAVHAKRKCYRKKQNTFKKCESEEMSQKHPGHISSQIIITFFFSMCYNPRHMFISVMRSTFKTVVCDLSSDV